jgi:DNA-binding SARP family transcriptional activator
VLGDQGHQRRRLALLAVLAVSGEQGRSRDQLLGLFWPEVSQARARHSLEQLLYAIRTSLDDDVFEGVNPLRLNAACIESDVGSFAEALARGELEAAVAMHVGQFLEGFYLRDAPAFEQWMDAERGRIARSYTDALERLAKKSQDANDLAAAAWWHQKLIDADPLSSKYAVGLIRALVSAGDHASALKYAERYEVLLRQELGTSVGPEMARLVDEVRARAKTRSVVARDTSPPAKIAGTLAESESAPSDSASHQSEQPERRARTRRRGTALYGFAALALAALIAASWLRPRARIESPAIIGGSPSTAAARDLNARLAGSTVAARRHSTRNIAAYELYLRGSDPALFRSDSGLRLGLETMRNAIALDSTYAAAYAGMAPMYIQLLLGQSARSSIDELYTLAKQSALKAVALDDSLAEAHRALGVVLMVRYNLAAAEKELNLAAALDPANSRAHKELSTLYKWEERPADALAEATLAVESEPLSPNAQIELARSLCFNSQYAEGLARLKQLEAVRPPLLRIPLYTGLCDAMKQDWPAAIAAMRRSGENRGRGFLGYAIARSGQRQEALGILAELENHVARTNQGAFEVAVVHAGLGNRDRAFEWLDRSKDDLSLSENIMLPVFDDLHADPRFARLRTWLRR